MADAQPSWHASSCLEKVLEHRFVAELTSALWLNGIRDFEVLRSDVDSHGYDLVVEAGGILRHIQLKAMVQGGKRRDVSINLRLASKPSGCLIWFTYNPETLALGPFHWFGGLPGEPLPDPGARPAKHSKQANPPKFVRCSRRPNRERIDRLRANVSQARDEHQARSNDERLHAVRRGHRCGVRLRTQGDAALAAGPDEIPPRELVDDLSAACERFRCSQCGGRPFRIGPRHRD